ncbi:Xanthine dehydrogenase/oxidase [Amphibalanus amphitrite]|uniref:Xanthine dehydrogenase/oxidase n=1 Tax=Amphibalanus amphitrite TaxID=1232801 RepID=A0A6A4V7B7_AMPAM|nr:Xanthine dehydrogenase/oxidase [Amphibalanus amphitrite]
MPLCAAHGLAVTTVEGIGSSKTRLHPVQERLAKSHGSQCGFCTPGIVMSMYTLLRNQPQPSMQDVETYMQGNLCRCTGYRAILDGLRTLTTDSGGCGVQNCCRTNGSSGCGPGDRQTNGTGSGQNGTGSGENGTGSGLNGSGSGENGTNSGQNGTNSGQNGTNSGENGTNSGQNGTGSRQNGTPTNGTYREEDRVGTSLFNTERLTPYDPSQEAIFPPELMLRPDWVSRPLKFSGPRVTWHRPATLSELLRLKATYPNAKLVNGNTEIGVEVKLKRCEYPVLINPGQVTELTSVTWDEDGVTFGAAVTLSDIEAELLTAQSQQPAWKTRVFSAITEMLRWFAGTQIRNVSAIGGNIMTGSPISDLVPLLMSADSQLTLMTSSGEQRTVPIRGFYTAYRRNVAKPDEILLSVTVPYTAEDEFFMGFKQAHRRDDDIAIVNAGFFVRIRDQKVHTFRATSWDDSLLQEAVSLLLEDLPLGPSAPGGMIEYRRTLTLSFFFKFYLQTCGWITGRVDESCKSVLEKFHRPTPASTQLYQVVPDDQPVEDLVGRPVAHMSALKQVTGEAQYLDDIPPLAGELHAGFVLSSRAHARIASVDAREALQEPGATHFFSAKDIAPERNKTGPSPHHQDEEVFRAETVTSMGQVIGLVLACDRATAQRAAKKDAIRENSFTPTVHYFEHGDVNAAFSSAAHVVEGSVRMGGQEHFYLETVGCIAVPKEDNEMEVHVSSQGLNINQMLIARALGVPANRIVCKAKRLGGGFGGKESRTCSVTTPVAVAANRSGRPVRAVLERDEDMASMGTRHPMLAKYRAGVTVEGKVTCVEMEIFLNAGFSHDLSLGVISRATTSCDNAYHYPAYRITGKLCLTNTPSNTAFRGFGGPQGSMVAEAMMDDIASQLRLDATQVRMVNLVQEGHLNVTRQPMVQVTVDRCIAEVVQKAGFRRLQREVETFNRLNRWKKRGVALIPNKFNIAFGLALLNQGGALVHIYTDGSVLVTVGGVEMGQGLFTKCYQVVTRVLGVSADRVYISETATDKVPNASPTAASMSTDLYGAAVLNACEQLRERLAPFRKAAPDGTFSDWVLAAYQSRVCLSVCGFEATKGLAFDPLTHIGDMYSYFVFGAACSLVEVDCLTGDHQVLKTDIVMDVGESLNPAIDIGQIEGAFMQGYGLFCMERLKYSPNGFNFTRGPGAYKIPGFGDIPLELHVSLLRGSPNPRAVYSSKAVGEPPLFSAASVFFAIKEAVRAARAQNGISEPLRMESPATPDRIRMACRDMFTDKLPPAPEPGSFKPWMVDL